MAILQDESPARTSGMAFDKDEAAARHWIDAGYQMAIQKLLSLGEGIGEQTIDEPVFKEE